MERWLGEVNIEPQQWTLTGPNLGTHFSVFIKGDPLLSARLTKKARMSLCVGGVWKKLRVPTPLSTKEEPKEAELVIRADESPQKGAERWLGNRVAQVLREQLPSRNFYFDHRANRVKCGSVEVAEMVCESRESQRPKWRTESLAELGIDKAAALQALAQAISGPSGAASSSTWSF